MPFLAPFVAAIGSFATAAAGVLGGFVSFLQSGTILAGLVKAGFAMAAQYVLGALFQPKPQSQASQLQVAYGDDLPRTVILGSCGTAGHHVFRNAFGKGNRRIVDVHVVSHFRVSEFKRFRGQGHWRTAPTTDGGQLPGIDGFVSVENYFGTMDQTASSTVVDNSGGRWTSDARGAGVAYCVVRTNLNREKLTQPWDPFFEVVGPYLYDWRKDTSVGGDGDDRWDDQDSWSGRRDNPVLQMYALERGLFNGTEMMVGKGVSASRLPLAYWTTAANICDEDAGEGRLRYSSSIIASAGEGTTHDANMQPLLEACAASWVEDAEGEYPIVGASQSVVATFTDDDLVVGEAFRFSKFRPRDELVNTAAGSFTDPTIFYEKAPIATRIDTGALAVDGERLAVSLPFPAVTNSAQADELADIALRANRYQASAEICLKPKFLRIKPGRWVQWNSAKYGNRTFLVVNKRLGALGTNTARNVYLTLQEVGSGIFTATGYETVPTDPAPPGTPDYQSELDNVVVQPWVLTSEATGSRPAIRVGYDAIEDVTITEVEFEYWPSAQTNEVQYDSAPADFTVKFLTVGIISSTEYKVRYRLKSDPHRDIPWVGPFTVTTPAANADDVNVTFAQLSQNIKDALAHTNAQVNLTRSQLEQLAAAVLESTSKAVKSNSVAVRFRDAQAAALQEISADIDEIDGELIATSEAITALNATVGDSGGGAFWRMNVTAGEGEVVSRIELQVRATVNDEWVSAATIWEAGFTDESPSEAFGRIILAAAQTMIADGEGNLLALFDEDGVHIANARIANLTGDQISFNTLTGDHIVALSIDSPSLAFESVTEYGDLNYYEDVDIDDDEAVSAEAVVDIAVDNPSGNPLIMIVNLSVRFFSVSGSGSGSAAMSIRQDHSGGEPLAQVIRAGFSNGTNSENMTIFIPAGTTSTSFQVYRSYSFSVGASSGLHIEFQSVSGVLWWKR